MRSPKAQRRGKTSAPAKRAAVAKGRKCPVRIRRHRGLFWLQNPLLNKGTAFSEEEREALGLRGLLPPRVHTQQEQVLRVLINFHKKPNDLERYIQLIALQDRNETLFYRVIMDNLEEMMPIIYTPTVGRACQEYGNLFRRPRGIYISIRDRGHVARLLRNWPQHDARVIVVTDGERILGLGDLGTFGMGIPVGKLSLYTACAGVHPALCLPVTIDVGTDNEILLQEPLYTGLKQRRVRGEAYDALIEEFVIAVQKVFPKALIQFEDFANRNAFRLLAKYQNRVCCFNDDIQGTGAVAFAGLCSALRVTRGQLRDQTILFAGAGEAGIGIAHMIVAQLVEEGLTEAEARRCCWFVDSKGLVVQSRTDLNDHKLPFAHEHEPRPDLLSAVQALRPNILIGASGVPRTFTREIVDAMSRFHKRPVIFALSNPTSKAECTAEEAYAWSRGQAIFASGSPFAPVPFEGRTFVPGQGNNAYIFPGVGLGIVATESRRVTDAMFLKAARALADHVLESELAEGRVYPSLRRMPEVSAAVATAVAEEVYREKLARRRRPKDLLRFIQSQMYRPDYTQQV